MTNDFARIFIRRGLEDLPEVQAAIGERPAAQVEVFDKLSQVVIPGHSIAEKIDNGKRTLVIDKRSSSPFGRFENTDPEAVCPAFEKLTTGTNCVYDCEYCHLQGSCKDFPLFLCVYVTDFDRFRDRLRRRYARRAPTVLVNAGEMSDPLRCDVLGNMPRFVEAFAESDHARLLVVTKSGYKNVLPLLKVRHAGRTVLSWSINCELVITRHEHKTASLIDRLVAAKAAQHAGYEVRFRLDPLLPFEGWETAYARSIDAIYEMEIHPSRFTLGSSRLFGNLRGIIAKRFPDSRLLAYQLQKNGKRSRIPDRVRESLYRHAMWFIHKYDPSVRVALCKETPNMHAIFAGVVDKTKCNCLS